MPKITGKAGKELAEQTGKSVAGASDNILSKLTKLWKVSDEAAEAGAKSAEKAGKELMESTLHRDFAGDFALKVRDTTNKIYQNLSGAEAQATSIIESSADLQRIVGQSVTNPKAFAELIATKGQTIGLKIPQEIMEGGPDVIKKFVMREMQKGLGSVNQAKSQLHYINRAKEVLNQPEGLRNLKQLLDVERKQAGGFFGSGLESKIPNLRSIMDEAEDVYKMDRSGVSNIKFLQEAIGLKSDNPKMFGLFVANPKNAARWTKMKNSPGYVGKMIKEMDPRVSIKRRLIGLTPGDTVKNLGLGVATLGTGYAAVKVYNWFGNNNPSETARTSSNIGSGLGNLRVSGEGKTVVQDAKSALTNITFVSNKVNSGLSDENAAETAREFIDVSSRELGNLYSALEKWDIVIQNSDDPKAALTAYQHLGEFANVVATGLNELGGRVGTGRGISGKGPISQRGRPPSKNIQQVQEFIGIGPTGQLDDATAQALRKLENDFNSRAATTKFTGLFVVPNQGFVADIDVLREAQRRIQKY